jgi:hypothetical protein
LRASDGLSQIFLTASDEAHDPSPPGPRGLTTGLFWSYFRFRPSPPEVEAEADA